MNTANRTWQPTDFNPYLEKRTLVSALADFKNDHEALKKVLSILEVGAEKKERKALLSLFPTRGETRGAEKEKGAVEFLKIVERKYSAIVSDLESGQKTFSACLPALIETVLVDLKNPCIGNCRLLNEEIAEKWPKATEGIYKKDPQAHAKIMDYHASNLLEFIQQ